MSLEIIQQRLLGYHCQNVLEQGHALKEIAQEIALMALSRAGFFRISAFQGGTCLRILYGLQRFSEDLDFVLEKPDSHFDWEPFVKGMQEEFSAYGYVMEVLNRTKLDKAVRTTFLKADSTGGILVLRDNRTNRPKMQIKLEIDTNPPKGSEYELKYLNFPIPFSIQTQNLPSLFAGKIHALLCREYTKGRDWFDFLWYVSRKTTINFFLLENAIGQAGPWKDKQVVVTREWLQHELILKINTMDWRSAKQDIARFLRPNEQAALEIWSKDFFLSQVALLV